MNGDEVKNKKLLVVKLLAGIGFLMAIVGLFIQALYGGGNFGLNFFYAGASVSVVLGVFLSFFINVEINGKRAVFGIRMMFSGFGLIFLGCILFFILGSIGGFFIIFLGFLIFVLGIVIQLSYF